MPNVSAHWDALRLSFLARFCAGDVARTRAQVSSACPLGYLRRRRQAGQSGGDDETAGQRSSGCDGPRSGDGLRGHNPNPAGSIPTGLPSEREGSARGRCQRPDQRHVSTRPASRRSRSRRPSRAEGRDCLIGQRGNDLIRASVGDDRVNGGRGRDRIIGAEGSDHVRGARGADRLTGGPGGDFVIGSRGDDKLSGGKQNDVISGRKGDDQVGGAVGGGEGEDLITGGKDDDRIFDLRARNRIFCGQGFDRVVTNARSTVAANCESVTVSSGYCAGDVAGERGDRAATV